MRNIDASPPSPDAGDEPPAATLAALHARCRAQMQARLAAEGCFWVFAYGSLIWKPAFEASEARRARLWGYHRALRMSSLRDRGTPQRPGLVFALLPGGSCAGVVQAAPAAQAEAVFEHLWRREMEASPYRPKWVCGLTAQGPVTALSFVLPRHSRRHLGGLSEGELLDILRHARGRYGSTLDYLLDTDAALRRHGIHDRSVRETVALARRHRLAVAETA